MLLFLNIFDKLTIFTNSNFFQEESQRLFNTDKGEFSCPLCRQLSNGVLPVLPENVFNGIKVRFVWIK